MVSFVGKDLTKKPGKQTQTKKRKVVTVEEKCRIFQKILHAEHEIYSLKELETIIPRKSNGAIHSMVIKELIEHMSNEDMINVEKCGNVNVYYSFPFTQIQKDETLYQNILTKHENLKKSITELETKINFINSNKSAELNRLNKELKAKIKKDDALTSKITQSEQKLKDNNTNDLQKILNEQIGKTALLKNNIDVILDYVLQKFPHIARKELLTEIGLPHDLLN